MKNQLFLSCLLMVVMPVAFAHDHTAYVGTGGIHAIKNQQIAVKSLDLYISKHHIDAQYQLENTSDQAITETVLLPLPLRNHDDDPHFANTADLMNSLKIWINGQSVVPNLHVRAFAYDKGQRLVEVTEALKSCGLSQTQLMNPWNKQHNAHDIQQKIQACDHPKIQALRHPGEKVNWGTQIIYSWKQTFPAHQTTEIKHTYEPLIGGGVYYPQAGKDNQKFHQQHCVDRSFLQDLSRAQSYRALSYMLKTGNPWIQPIEHFQLTIERPENELISLCWDGNLKKISPTRFQAQAQHFLPKRDLDILFVPKK